MLLAIQVSNIILKLLNRCDKLKIGNSILVFQFVFLLILLSVNSSSKVLERDIKPQVGISPESVNPLITI